MAMTSAINSPEEAFAVCVIKSDVNVAMPHCRGIKEDMKMIFLDFDFL
jgi:hypothetical protein